MIREYQAVKSRITVENNLFDAHFPLFQTAFG